MSKLSIFLLTISLTMFNLSPFSSLALKLNSNGNSELESSTIDNQGGSEYQEEETTNEEEKTSTDDDNTSVENETEVEEEETTSKIKKPTQVVDLDGYARLKIYSNYKKSGENMYKCEDGKTIQIGYKTGIKLKDTSTPTDYKVYIVKKLAGVDKKLNKAEKIQIGDKIWNKVSTEEKESNIEVIVYYLLSNSKKHVLYIKFTLDSKYNTKEFNNNVEKILSSVNVYYTGEKVFDTPTGGFYNDDKKK